MPRNLRTDAGRLVVGLVGDMVLVASLVRLWWRCASAESSEALPGGGDSVCGGEPGDFGVGCDDSGPLPGVGGRGDSGGLSSGAGIDVPSVREKLMGDSVSGLKENLLEPMVVSSCGADGRVWQIAVGGQGTQDEVESRQLRAGSKAAADERVLAEAAGGWKLRRCFGEAEDGPGLHDG
jgi:hypothetical protein